MVRRAKVSRWNTADCRELICGHQHHPKPTPEQQKVLSHVRSQRSYGWHNGARVGNLPRI